MNFPAEGGCTCGAVRYRLSGEPILIGICHCTECQRQSGSAFGMSMRVRRTDITLIQGEFKHWERVADNGARIKLCFCGQCGTRIWHEPAGEDFLNLKPGTLDNTTQLAPRYQVYAKRKHGWLHFDSLSASFEEGPPGFGRQT